MYVIMNTITVIVAHAGKLHRQLRPCMQRGQSTRALPIDRGFIIIHADHGHITWTAVTRSVHAGPRLNTYRVWLVRAQCRRASRFEPVAAVGPCSRTDRPTAEPRKTPSDWRRKTVTCRRQTSRPRLAPRTTCARLSNTIFQAKAAKYVTRMRLSRNQGGETCIIKINK